jgi:hypothetical protein
VRYCLTLFFLSANGLGQIHPAKPAPYHYEAFNDKESIRVLTLLPPNSSPGEIYIKLSIVRLKDNPVYEALSYTWGTVNGDASLCSTINCDRGQIKVTKNCEDALGRLRRTTANESCGSMLFVLTNGMKKRKPNRWHSWVQFISTDLGP